MFKKRLLVCCATVTGLSPLVSRAYAQSIDCSTATLNGTWEFVNANIYVPGFACPLTIKGGSISSAGKCDVATGSKLTVPPAGQLKMDKTCYATGSMSFTVVANPNTDTLSLSVHAWLSADGSRLTGFAAETESPNPGSAIFPFELIYVLGPPP